MKMVSFIIRVAFLIFLTSLVVVFIWSVHPLLAGEIGDMVTNAKLYMKSKKHAARFSNDVVEYEKFKEICYLNTEPNSVSDIKVYASKLNNRKLMCRHNYNLFRSIYYVYYRYATIEISKSFMKKLEKWFPGRRDLIEATRNQTLIFINNLFSYESVVFNIVRANRPVASVHEGGTLNYVNGLVTKSASSCPFCSYANATARDSLGRMESKHAVITSTTFKVDIYHSVAILKTHNPLYFSQVQFIDCMDLIMQWFHKVHSVLPTHLYRIIYWDVLAKAGAGHVHPAMDVTLGDYSYHARWHRMHRAATEFSSKNGGSNYWTSLLQIHTLLGLSYRYGDASLMAYLNPQKDAEVMIISEKPCLDFFRLVFFTIRAYIDDLQLYALSMSITFPKLNANADYGDELPVIFRMVSRGSADSSRSDIGSFGFFGTVNVNRDPYKLFKPVKESIMKRKDEPFAWNWNH